MRPPEKIKRDFKNVSFSILGRSEEEAKLGLSSKDIKSFVNEGIVNWIDQTDDVRPFLTDADIVVLPSYREGLSRALLEACSMAKPIITTDVPGCRELITTPPNGYLCKSRDTSSWKTLCEKRLKLIVMNYKKWD